MRNVNLGLLSAIGVASLAAAGPSVFATDDDYSEPPKRERRATPAYVKKQPRTVHDHHRIHLAEQKRWRKGVRLRELVEVGGFRGSEASRLFAAEMEG